MINFSNGCIVIKGLIDCFYATVSQIGLNPNQVETSFLFCEWSSIYTPKIYGFSSETEKITLGSRVIGDKEALSFITPYTKINLNTMKFEQVICHFKKGFSDVNE